MPLEQGGGKLIAGNVPRRAEWSAELFCLGLFF
jgi:hypothetical protein